MRDHYIKKVRELHRKLEHYEHGGGSMNGNAGLALRDMESTLVQRDGAVMGQARRSMALKSALSDALGCAHHAMWQSENHLTLTHVDARCEIPCAGSVRTASVLIC